MKSVAIKYEEHIIIDFVVSRSICLVYIRYYHLNRVVHVTVFILFDAESIILGIVVIKLIPANTNGDADFVQRICF